MSLYKKSDGLRYDLQQRWYGADEASPIYCDDRKEFPESKTMLLEQYHVFEAKMDEKWHPNVVLGAAVTGGGLLTDHGVAHVRSVIAHAKDILVDPHFLNGYEIYLLLMSIHFHDLGNISGREEHEQKIAELIEKMGEDLPLDNPEKEIVSAIATAHGGFCGEDKDTIRNISLDTVYAGVHYRPKALAAILRFADEISDDFNRAEFNGVIVPHQNEVFHEYSKALEPISIIGETIKFHFRIPYELTQRKVGKGSGEVYLYDEVLARMAKCMRELEYCRKFADGAIKPTTADIIIDFLQPGSSFRRKDRDSFRLTLHGYPDADHSTLADYFDKASRLGETAPQKELKFKDGNAVQIAMRGGEE